MANELAKSAYLRCRLEGVVFFRHFLRRTEDRAAHKRVKTLFASSNRVRGRSGLRRWNGRRRGFLLRVQSNGNCHQCNKHKTEFFVHETPFGNRATLRGHKERGSFQTPAIYYTHQVPSSFASDRQIPASGEIGDLGTGPTSVISAFPTMKSLQKLHLRELGAIDSARFRAMPGF